MREIKFRGHDGLSWIYGNSIVGNGDLFLMEGDNSDPNDTRTWSYVDCIGEFTGLKDVDEKEIYEGDIVRYNTWDNEGFKEEIKGHIEFYNGSFSVYEHKTGKRHYTWMLNECEIIGNTHNKN